MITLFFGRSPGRRARRPWSTAWVDRRGFIGTCTAGAACAAGSWPAFGADAKPKAWPRCLLVDEQGRSLRASSLTPRANYVFHYPYAATPVFLLDLDSAVAPQPMSTTARENYTWPGGVGAKRSIVAFSAICAHQLVYPTPEVSFISYRPDRARGSLRDGLIHCCAEHSEYDPARGARVVGGPAGQPLCAILLAHDPKADTLTAHGTLGGELFEDFFRKYQARLSLEMGSRVREPVGPESVVKALERFCRNPIKC